MHISTNIFGRINLEVLLYLEDKKRKKKIGDKKKNFL